MTEQSKIDAAELAIDLTIAWLSNPNNRAAAEDVPAFLRSMYATVTELTTGRSPTAASGTVKPATEQFVQPITARKSIASKDHIISMLDGKPYKTLRRHLSTHGMTPEQYRERFNLKADYPMVAESYSEARRSIARRIGMGKKGRQVKAADPAPAQKAKRVPRAAESA
jgi:predicted transcriptional regulator